MQLQHFFDVSLADDKAAFRRRLIDFAHAMDFSLVSGLLVLEGEKGADKFLYVGNMPEDCAQMSADPETSRRDPVMKRLKHQSVPFVYDQKFYVDSGAPDLWERAAPYGYRTGISVALHLPGNKHFLLGLDRERALPRSEQKVTRMLADLQLLAVHCQDAAQRVLIPQASPSVEIKLTDREREILQWTMAGKSSSVIGDILGISDATVKFHIKTAMKKLDDAPTKLNAVITALRLGLL